MRHIDTSVFIPPTNWAGKVINAQSHYARTRVFTEIWKDLLTSLNALVRTESNPPRKCWYSELLILGSDGVDVDHFRPKSNVKELSPKFANLEDSLWSQIYNIKRVGYDFLAFEWTNFRIASQHSNQGRKEGIYTKGKQDFFPLSIKNITTATDLLTLANETICLLDPCDKDDPELLKFYASGQVDASYPKDTWEYCRAKISIEVYHLNFDLKGLTSVRLEHWQMITREIEQLNRLYLLRDFFNQQNSILPRHMNEGIEDQGNKLIEFTRKSAQFSAVAIDCIKHHRITYIWLNSLFTNEMLKK